MSEHGIPFFNDVPTAALPATQKLWDAIDIPGYNALTAYNAFVQDLQVIGIAPPPRTVVRRWAAGVEAGLIDRPITGENKLRTKRTVESSPPLEETIEEVAPAPAPVSTRKAGTLKLRRELSDNEVTALHAIKETLTTDILTESPPCKGFSVPVSEVDQSVVTKAIVDASLPIDDASADQAEVSVAAGLDFNESLPINDKPPQFDQPLHLVDQMEIGDVSLDEVRLAAAGDPHISKVLKFEASPTISDDVASLVSPISNDPVQDAVDIIVQHYYDQEIAKARSVAAVKAAAALREFANRIEASA